jgi:putative copper resistance protein D
MMAHPLMALGMYAASLYAMYFTGFYELSLRSHAAHLFMTAHLVGAGYFFFWVLIGVDAAPVKIAHPVRVLLLFVSMVFHAIFGLVIMQSTQVFASDWYAALSRDWGGSPLKDQALGGGIAWSFGETPAAFVLGMIILQWVRSDRREERRLDKLAALSERSPERSVVDPHVAYNEYLASLERRSKAAERVDSG